MHTTTTTTTTPPPVTSFDSHPCQQSFPVSVFPAAAEMEKATLLRGFICLPVCFSLFAFIFIFYDCPLLPSKLPRETGEQGREGCRKQAEGGGLFWRRTRRIENGLCCEGGEMKKANLPVRAEEWENEREGSGVERERERILFEPRRLWRREIKSNGVKYCVRYDFDRIILTQGTISTTLLGCWWRQRPQGGAVTEGALTVKAHLTSSTAHQASVPLQLFSHTDSTVTTQVGPIKTFCSRYKNGWRWKFHTGFALSPFLIFLPKAVRI